MIRNYISVIAALLFLAGCGSSIDTAGSGSNTGNAFVVGIAEFNGAPYDVNCRVALIPANATSEDEILYSQLDDEGKFSFAVTPGEKYAIQIDDTLHGMAHLRQQVSGSSALLRCEMNKYGAVKLYPSEVTAQGGDITIPGTLIRRSIPKINAASEPVILKEFPAAIYSGLYLGRDSEESRQISELFVVNPNDTVPVVTTFEPVENSTSFNAGLPSKGVFSLSMDRDNRLLLGTDNGYVGIYDKEGWSYIDIYEYGVYSGVVSMVVDSDSSIWCGTFDGVLHLEEGKGTHYHTENSELPGNTIRSVAIDSMGNRWFTTVHGGIARMNDSSWTTYTPENSKFPSTNAFHVKADREAVWAITPEGIARFRNDEWYTFNHRNSPFSCDSMTALNISDSARWFAAYDGSLYLQTDGWWKRFDERNSPLTNYPIFALHVDREGTLWAANSNSELFAYNNDRWITLTPENSSIPKDCGMILSIVEQHDGNIFIATEKQGVIQLQSSVRHSW